MQKRDRFEKTILKAAMLIVGLVISLTALSGTGNAQDLQEIHKYEIFGGFSYADLADSKRGWNFIAVRNVNSYFGIAVDISSTNHQEVRFVLDSMNLYINNQRNLYLAGVQLANRDSERWTIYAQFTLGAERSSYDEDLLGSFIALLPTAQINSFAMSMGGGIDYQIKGPFVFRIIHANMILLRPPGLGMWDVRGKVSSGLVFRLGRPM
jgi:hypothetical protein